MAECAGYGGFDAVGDLTGLGSDCYERLQIQIESYLEWQEGNTDSIWGARGQPFIASPSPANRYFINESIEFISEAGDDHYPPYKNIVWSVGEADCNTKKLQDGFFTTDGDNPSGRIARFTLPNPGCYKTTVTYDWQETFGNTVALSDEVVFKVFDKGVEGRPDSPTGLTTSPNGVAGEVRLVWVPVVGANTYYLYWGEKPDLVNNGWDEKIALNSVCSRSICEGTLGGFQGDKAYYFRVSAESSAGESDLSEEEVSAVPLSGNSGESFGKILFSIKPIELLPKDNHDDIWFWVTINGRDKQQVSSRSSIEMSHGVSHEICFGSLVEWLDPEHLWIAPECQSISLARSETKVISITYRTESPVGYSGSLKVNIEPSTLSSAGVNVDGGKSYRGGYTFKGLAVDKQHRVCFSPVEGWNEPQCEMITVKADTTTTITGTYTQKEQPKYGSLKVSIEPSRLSSAGVNIDGGQFYRGGYTFKGLAVDKQHRVCFSPVEGWNEPQCEMITVKADATTTIMRSYTQTIETALLEALTILGPSIVSEENSANFQAIAIFSDGGDQDVTNSATWTINTDLSSIQKGRLTTEAVREDEPIKIEACYTTDGVTACDSHAVTITNTINDPAIDIVGKWRYVLFSPEVCTDKSGVGTIEFVYDGKYDLLHEDQGSFSVSTCEQKSTRTHRNTTNFSAPPPPLTEKEFLQYIWNSSTVLTPFGSYFIWNSIEYTSQYEVHLYGEYRRYSNSTPEFEVILTRIQE